MKKMALDKIYKKSHREMNKEVIVSIKLTGLDLVTLKRRFERMQKKYPHKMNPELTDEWIVKYCVFESKSLEIKRIKRLINKGLPI